MTTAAAKPRILVTGVWQETNTYSSRTTTLSDFEEFELASGDAVAESHAGVRSVIGGAMSLLGDRARFGFSAAAWPAGPADERTAGELVERFAAGLRHHTSSQGLILNLHGAMVAQGVDDVEARLTHVVRRELGDIPVVAVLDYHANPSREFLDSIDAVVAYKTYPHVDMFECGVEAVRIVDELIERQLSRSVRYQRFPLITSPLSQGSRSQPMKHLLHLAASSPAHARAVLTPGFAYSDVERAGLTVMVNNLSDGDASAADVVLEQLCGAVQEHQDSFQVQAVDIDAALAQLPSLHGRTMVVDVGDNIGGGSAGDGTSLLRALYGLEDRSSLVILCDSEAVANAALAGVGSRFRARLGGHTDAAHGEPLDVEVEVRRLSNGVYRTASAWMGGRQFDMGPSAVLQAGSTTVLTTSVPTPPFHLEQLQSQGIDPADYDILTAKGALAWQDAYEGCVDDTIFVDTPGVTPAFPDDLSRESTFEGSGPSWAFPARRGAASTATRLTHETKKTSMKGDQ